MPRFEPNPSKVSSTIEVLPKDNYHFRVGEPKAVERNKGNNAKGYGVQYPLTVISGLESGEVHKGKVQFFFVEWNNEDGSPSDFAGFNKRFLMAAMGYDPSDNDAEKRFNVDTEGMDWAYDSDTKYVGEFWMKLNGAGVKCDVDENPSKKDDGKVFQKFDRWYPVVD